MILKEIDKLIEKLEMYNAIDKERKKFQSNHGTTPPFHWQSAKMYLSYMNDFKKREESLDAEFKKMGIEFACSEFGEKDYYLSKGGMAIVLKALKKREEEKTLKKIKEEKKMVKLEIYGEEKEEVTLRLRLFNEGTGIVLRAVDKKGEMITGGYILMITDKGQLVRFQDVLNDIGIERAYDSGKIVETTLEDEGGKKRC